MHALPTLKRLNAEAVERAAGKEAKDFDTLRSIIDYEAGLLDEEETNVLFQHLVDTGLAWKLQGHFGRTADALIDAGHVTKV